MKFPCSLVFARMRAFPHLFVCRYRAIVIWRPCHVMGIRFLVDCNKVLCLKIRLGSNAFGLMSLQHFSPPLDLGITTVCQLPMSNIILRSFNSRSKQNHTNTEIPIKYIYWLSFFLFISFFIFFIEKNVPT